MSRKKVRVGGSFTPHSFTQLANMQPIVISAPGRRTGGKRPVDKLLINVIKSGVAGSTVTTTLVTATFPCTVVGLRWDISAACDAGTALGKVAWAIIILKDGETVNNLGTSDAGTLYNPEQNVMTWGNSILTGADQATIERWTGDTKTMRKLMGGDKLMFLVVGEATNTAEVRGTIQFFCKT